MKNKFCFLLALILVFCLFLGCEKSYEKFSDYSFDYFDTVATITGFEKDKADFDKNVSEIKSLLLEYHRLYDIYNSYDGINNLYMVNKVENGTHTQVKVDEKIIDLLLFAEQMYTKTNGKLNIGMGSVLKIWHNYRENGISEPENAQLPGMEILKSAQTHSDFNNIIIDETENTVFIKDPEMTLDVGAVAKGYAVEKTAEFMKNKGMGGYVLNVGGNVRTVGTRPDGENWKVGIENPNTQDTENPYIEKLSLGEMSLVTSGSYQRFYIVNGKNYHHIIDGETLMPAEYFTSVSVLCKDSAVADALSTALFCMAYEDGLKLLDNFKNTEVMWVKKDGTKFYTQNFKKYCE